MHQHFVRARKASRYSQGHWARPLSREGPNLPDMLLTLDLIGGATWHMSPIYLQRAPVYTLVRVRLAVTPPARATLNFFGLIDELSYTQDGYKQIFY